jgi:hypothetical protein
MLARPIIAFSLKVINLLDPIDGKVSNRCCRMDMKHSATMSFRRNTLSLERHRLLWLYLNEQTDFFTAPKSLAFCSRTSFYKLFRKKLRIIPLPICFRHLRM